ncbi:hypothetical protein PVAP13_1NG249219 [Panicum virgatum]|uniref:Uncharacterized protein n=1 Tax=Panicum virgatum TaxID=38727 RepID=A0A8T0WNE4_PANVG|nr:hypothetical protein PVAP13_1NG249219 [Panicum virgatum]
MAETQKTCSNGTLIRPRRGSGSRRPIDASPGAWLHDPAPGSSPIDAACAYQLAAPRGTGSRGSGKTPGPPGSSRPQPAQPQEARRRPAARPQEARLEMCYPREREDRRRRRCGLGVRCAAVLPKQVTPPPTKKARSGTTRRRRPQSAARSGAEEERNG